MCITAHCRTTRVSDKLFQWSSNDWHCMFVQTLGFVQARSKPLQDYDNPRAQQSYMRMDMWGKQIWYSCPQHLSANLRTAVARPCCRQMKRACATSPDSNLQWDWRLAVSNLMEPWVAYDIYISISQMFNMRSIKGILGSVQWATLSEDNLYNTMLVSAILWNSLLYCTRQNCMPSCIVRVADYPKCAAKTCHWLLAMSWYSHCTHSLMLECPHKLCARRWPQHETLDSSTDVLSRSLLMDQACKSWRACASFDIPLLCKHNVALRINLCDLQATLLMLKLSQYHQKMEYIVGHCLLTTQLDVNGGWLWPENRAGPGARTRDLRWWEPCTCEPASFRSSVEPKLPFMYPLANSCLCIVLYKRRSKHGLLQSVRWRCGGLPGRALWLHVWPPPVLLLISLDLAWLPDISANCSDVGGKFGIKHSLTFQNLFAPHQSHVWWYAKASMPYRRSYCCILYSWTGNIGFSALPVHWSRCLLYSCSNFWPVSAHLCHLLASILHFSVFLDWANCLIYFATSMFHWSTLNTSCMFDGIVQSLMA